MKIKTLLVGLMAMTALICMTGCNDEEEPRQPSASVTPSVETFTISSPDALKIQFSVVVKSSSQPKEGGLCYKLGNVIPTVADEKLILYPNPGYSTVDVTQQQDGSLKITGTISNLQPGYFSFRPYMKFEPDIVVYGDKQSVNIETIN